MHIKNWIERSSADYYTLFIGTWIPFNAWYRDTYYDPTSCRTDKDMITKIQTTDNRYKNKLKNCLIGHTEDAILFKRYLANLHKNLEMHTVPNNEKRISFRTIWAVENNLDTYTFSHGAYSYKISKIAGAVRGAKQFRIEIIRNRDGSTADLIDLFKKDINELKQTPEYSALSTETKKEKVTECLTHVLNHKPANIIKSPTPNGKKPGHSILIDEVSQLYFSDDVELDAKAIIQMLYQLRCIVFHGELEPTLANMGIYENAYYIQKMLIQELI